MACARSGASFALSLTMTKIFLNLLIISVLGLFAVPSFAGGDYFDAQKDDLMPAKVDELHPTQGYVGYIEVKPKAKELKKMSKSERKEFLRKNPIPVVVGPGGDIYPIDHHHLARAVSDSGHQKIFIKIVENKSALTEAEFWAWMKEKQYVDLIDDNGNKIEVADLPRFIEEMRDDPYRSLAGAVREQGGFKKDMTPFAEFKWALFFRQYFSRESLDSNFDKVVKAAVKLAKSQAAQGLPGYIGIHGSCHSVF